MSRNRKNKSTRVNSTNARQSLRSLSNLVSPVSYNRIPSNLRDYEDRRRWHPEGAYAPAKSFNRSRHRLVDQTSRPKQSQINRSYRGVSQGLYSPTSKIGFAIPSKVLTCVRRRVREQVLHALRKTGRGGQKKPRYSWYSKIRCK